VEALTYRGWLLVRVGSSGNQPQLVADGETYLDKAIAANASYPDAECFKAIVRFRVYGDAAGAKGPVDRCLAANPPTEVVALVANLKSDIDTALAGPTTSTTTAG
jgi:hypothetical protein